MLIKQIQSSGFLEGRDNPFKDKKNLSVIFNIFNLNFHSALATENTDTEKEHTQYTNKYETSIQV